jgi:mRNA-degrading endonuclease toxin of MazEF toxin-antitoxin module
MTASIKKGNVYVVNFDPTIGAEVKKNSPAVIISNDVNNANSPDQINRNLGQTTHE